MAWIIKDNRKKYKIRCDICESIVGFTQKDIIINVDEYFGEIYSCSYIRCPSCHSKIIFSIDGEEVIHYETLD